MSRIAENHINGSAPLLAMEPTSAGPIAISRGAISTGRAAAAAWSAQPVALGRRRGLATASPWAHHRLKAPTVGFAAIHWAVVTPSVAYAIGGYLAGRRRSRWVAVHPGAVFFRDTAHGFLARAVATPASAVGLSSGIAMLGASRIHAGGGRACPMLGGTHDRMPGGHGTARVALLPTSRCGCSLPYASVDLVRAWPPLA